MLSNHVGRAAVGARKSREQKGFPGGLQGASQLAPGPGGVKDGRFRLVAAVTVSS